MKPNTSVNQAPQRRIKGHEPFKKSTKAARPAPAFAKDRGRFAMLDDCISSPERPDQEWGPEVFISATDYGVWDVIGMGQAVAGGTAETVFVPRSGIEMRLFVFMPLVAPRDTELMRAATVGWASGKLTLKHVAAAQKNIRWFTTALRGSEFLQYVRRIVALGRPDGVLIWPLQYYLGADVDVARNSLLHETGWVLHPESCESSDEIDYHLDEDDPQDWWKQ